MKNTIYISINDRYDYEPEQKLGTDTILCNI